MKTEILIGLICVAVLIGLLLTGCTQTIINEDGLKINTFLMTSGLESLYFDPDGIFEVGKYKGIPADIKIRYNPVTRSLEFVSDSN